MKIETNLIWEIVIGVGSGVYSGLIVARMARFAALVNEALRLVRGIDYVGGLIPAPETLHSMSEVSRQFTFISSDFYGRGHRAAGEALNKLQAEFGRIIGTRRTERDFDKLFLEWQQRIRKTPPSLKSIFKPWFTMTEL